MLTSDRLKEKLKTARTIFQRYHTGPFYLFTMQNPRKLNFGQCIERVLVMIKMLSKK